MTDPDDIIISGPFLDKDNDPQIEMPAVDPQVETIIDLDIDPVPEKPTEAEAKPEPKPEESSENTSETSPATHSEEPVAEQKNDEPAVIDLTQIEAMIKALEEKFDKKIATDAHKAELFDKLYDELAQYKKDLYSKLLIPFVNQVISLIEDYNRVLQKVDTDTDQAKLLKYLSMVPDDLEELLQDNGIECYQEEGERYNPKTQRAVGLVMTADMDKDGLVAERVRKGFWWQGRILKHETVKVYKYKA